MSKRDSLRSLENELRAIAVAINIIMSKDERPRARGIPSLCVRITDTAHAALVKAAAEHWDAPVTVKEAAGILLAWGVTHYRCAKAPKKPKASTAGVRVCIRMSQATADKLWSMAGAPRIPGKKIPKRKPCWGVPIAPDTAGAIVLTWAITHHPRKV